MTDGKFTLSDLKKHIAINNHSPDLEITLCKTGRNILVKPLRVKDKKELLKALEGKNKIIINKVLDDIIDSYVVPCDGQPFEGNSLCLQERHQILVYIRAANGDAVAKIAHQCPKCEKITKNIEYDIVKDLHVVEYKEPEHGKVVTICDGNVEIHYDVLYRKDEMQVESYVKTHKLKSMIEEQLAYISASIKKIYLVQNKDKKEVNIESFDEMYSFIENQLSSSDLKVITDAIESLNFGVRMPFDFTCSHCDYTSQEEVSITVFFIS